VQLARAATKAADENDPATYLAKMQAAAALRPDMPRILVNLAAAHIANAQNAEAFAALEKLAALGLHSPVEKSPEFAAVRALPKFQAVCKKLAANLYPIGKGEVALTLRNVTGLIEGIAWRAKTGEFYFGDVNARTVWRRTADGNLHRLTPPGDGLFGVFGLAIDEANGTLWAATSAVPAMRGFTSDQDGMAALAEIDLNSGAIRRTLPIERRAGDQQSHVLGDLALGPDGTVWLTDSGGPLMWRLPPGAPALEPFVESADFASLQGVVVRPGGTLVVSDYPSGLFRIDPNDRSVRRIDTPPGHTLVGIDGLAAGPTGELYAIQNGTRPNRVLKIDLDATDDSIRTITVVEGGHIMMAAPSLGCFGAGGDLFFVGNAGWTRFEETGGAPSAPRSVPIFRFTPDKTPRKAAP
jgi:sugar lactone lactonase YvrE